MTLTVSWSRRPGASKAVSPSAPEPMTPYLPPDSETVFLVSGGARGITARCAIQLAQRFQSRFVLLGRSACAPEPAWAVGASGAAALKQAALQAMLAQGQKPKP